MNRNVRDIGQKNVQTREPPLFIFRLQINNKNFSQNVVSMVNKFATAANIKWEESEQGWKQWCQSNGKFIIINFKHYRDNAK